jgi:hypothetical protein
MVKLTVADTVSVHLSGSHMTTVNLTINSKQQTFPTGTQPGTAWNFQVKNPAGNVQFKNVFQAGNVLSFSDLNPGDYIAIGQRVGAGNTPLGGPTPAKPFTVPDPGVSLEVADTIDVALT